MDYKNFQEFMTKYDFDQKDIKMLNELMRSCIIPQNKKKPKRKLYSFRLNEEDMTKIKEMAELQGLPYQTLVWSIIHKYVNTNL